MSPRGSGSQSLQAGRDGSDTVIQEEVGRWLSRLAEGHRACWQVSGPTALASCSTGPQKTSVQISL